ncbi:MAG: phosphoribosylaminoimidazolesuccinocarboxamide synthase, partial [Planctomycetes bacterium]|nr:phosphoribosylaminoimidazolesuccinocarboxamide synthase [Planctomycetota bacterium]
IIANHIVPASLKDLPPAFRQEEFDGRFMLCRPAKVVPVECVVRGYLAGSGWKEYQESGTVCGIRLPAGLTQCDRLPEPIFTPATKAELGAHDENIPFERAAAIVGEGLAARLRDVSLALYRAGRDYAAQRGIIIADTKFEFGFDESGQLMIVDEVLTPDSSRFWPADTYAPGQDQASFDKQFVRNWLEEIGFNKQPPAPVLPKDVVQGTRDRYIEAFTRLTDRPFPWA